jgi:hypothetical protein
MGTFSPPLPGKKYLPRTYEQLILRMIRLQNLVVTHIYSYVLALEILYFAIYLPKA